MHKKNTTFLVESASKVKLRGRTNGSGDLISLYLDWMENGKRSYEFLEHKLYNKPKSPEEKGHNESVKKIALERLAIKNLELLKDSTTLKAKVYSNILFKEFYLYCRDYVTADNKRKELSTKVVYDSVINKLEDYCGNRFETLKLKEIDSRWGWGLREYLLNSNLSKGTAAEYLNKVKAITKMAVKKEYLDKDPLFGVDPIRKQDPQVNYIFHEDLLKLRDTPFEDPILYKVGLFASQTGLRCVDIKRLRWKDVIFSNNKYSIPVRQKKTDKPYIVHFRQDVMDLIGPAGSPDELIFPGFKNDNKCNSNIKIWFLKAGIVARGNPNASFTPHDFRHTFAINLGINGANLYEISQMLGHTEISTTEKYYARILDSVKREIIDKMPKL